jgi:soluble lytic murein transglycosylase
LILVIGNLPEEQKNDSNWRYWDARARLEAGELDQARELLGELALEASYFGFLAADRLDFPYAICPEEPDVTALEVAALRQQPGFSRSIELRNAGIPSWSRSEWQIAVRNLDQAGLRVAAALAVEENWPDMAIFALGNSGDLRWYAWRFPLDHVTLVESQASNRNLDPAWVLGLMRSESAMALDARSPAGALGLMQLMPGTAEQLAKRYSIGYAGSQQLLQAGENIELGTLYLRELLDRFSENPVLATGAYNAGPNAVKRWMTNRRTEDPEIWIETLPYFETRDYIPRVLAFSTIYDWRMARPVSRISSRMPGFTSSDTSVNMRVNATANVVCAAPGEDAAAAVYN